MNYLWEFLVFIAATLVGNGLWQLWLDKREIKNQKVKALKECLAKIQSCILELEYNITPGVGGSRCHFKLRAQEELMHSAEIYLLGEELANSLKQLVIEAGIANGEYSMKNPGEIKSMSNLLKAFLQKKSQELQT